MRSVAWHAEADGVSVRQLLVVEDSPRWCHHELIAAPRLTLVHKGVFGLRSGRWRGQADPVTAYPGLPGHEQSISHRPGSVDAYTVITPSGREGERLRALTGPLHTPARVDLDRRVLASRVRDGADAFEVADRVHSLLRRLLDPASEPVPSGRDRASHRKLAAAARRLLAERPRIDNLTELAGELGTSRSHLSRVFHRETGVTLAHWRMRIRMQRLMDDLTGGAADLSRLAASLGFADHAHLTRATRRELGATPSRLRGLLAARGAS